MANKRIGYWVVVVVLLVAVPATGLGQQRPTPKNARWFDGPAPTRSVIPDYAPVAVATCVQGTAWAIVELSQDGHVHTADFIGPPLFEKDVVAASRQWLFEATSSAAPRRQVLQFLFEIVPRTASTKAATSFLRSATTVVVRRRWVAGGACLDCSLEAERRMHREQEKQCVS